MSLAAGERKKEMVQIECRWVECCRRWRLQQKTTCVFAVDTGSVRIVQSPPGFAPLGSRLLLSCSHAPAAAAAAPAAGGGSSWPADVWWVRGGRRRVDGRWLVIEHVTRDDDGRYTCVVDRAGHRLSADTVVRVQCASSPLNHRSSTLEQAAAD